MTFSPTNFIPIFTGLLLGFLTWYGWQRKQAGASAYLPLVWLGLIFLLLVAGMTTAGYFSYQNFVRQHLALTEKQLVAIAELKVEGLQNWRQERLADANLFYRNVNFSDRVKAYLENPQDAETRARLLNWLEKMVASPEYSRILLLDSQGIERLALPETSKALPKDLPLQAADSLNKNEILFIDFHLHPGDNCPCLSMLVPIYDSQDAGRPLAVLVLRIDPETSLYPYLKQWPVFSETAETLLVRREGNEALFLNPLRFQPQAALNLRIPLTKMEMLAVKAVQGQTGVAKGLDYRGQPALGALHAIPGTPWVLVTHMDIEEVYAPLHERLWQMVTFFGALILAAGTGLGLIWRQQRMRYYRAQAEIAEALRASEERFRLAFETSPDAININRLDDGKYIAINQGFTQLTGYTQADVIGKSSLDLNIWDDPQDRQRLVEGLKQSGKVENLQAHFRRKDGSLGIGLMSAALIELAGIPHILSITRDITEREQIAQALQETEARYRALVEQIPAIVYTDSAEQVGQTLYISPQIQTLLGYSPEEWINNNEFWLEIMHPEDRERVSANYYQASQNNQPFTAEYRLLACDGREVWIRDEATLIYDSSGPPFWQGILLDITARKYAEEQVAKYTEKLEEMVDERTRQLKDAQEQLLRQERLAALGQVAGSIGHELRNPLGVIANAVYFLKLVLTDANTTVRDYLDIIENETRTADKIVTELLDFTRIKSLDRQPVSVSELVAHAFERYPAPPSVQVTLDIPPGLPPVYADRRHVEQILGNLVTNAYQAMSDEGRLSVISEQFSVSSEHWIRITVEDSGPGIPPANLEKIFEPLFTTKPRGIGLGLPVSRKLAEANGGRLEVHSELGKGAAFTLYLPVYKEPL